MSAPEQGEPLLYTSRSMLRDRLAEEAPRREATVAGWVKWIGLVSLGMALAAHPILGWPHSGWLAAQIGVYTAYYAVLHRLLKRGWYRSAISWVNVAIETSIAPVMLLTDLWLQGPVYALTAPPLMIWASLIALSGLRCQPRMALGAGILGAVENLGISFLILPQLPPGLPVSLSTPLILVRTFALLCAGSVTAIFAEHLIRKAEEVVAAVREKDLFGKYLLHERIGAGGMAEVFRASYSPEGGFQKTVAIKRVLPAYSEDSDFIAMFREEAQLTSRLNHPNIVQILDLGRHQSLYYLALEFVDGVPLSRLLKVNRSGLPFEVVSFLGVELATALDYAHRRAGPDGTPLRIIHRDVNPPNVLLSIAGEVKLSDFGIARAATQAHQTTEGIVKGKHGYMAPEQASGNVIDHRVDLYGLGLTLHEAITGVRVLRGDSTRELMDAAVEQPIPLPSQLRPDTPPELERIVMALLEKNPDRRTASAREVRDALAALTGAAAPWPMGPTQLQALVRRVRESKESRPDLPTLGLPPPALAEQGTQPHLGEVADNATTLERDKPTTASGRR